MLNEIISAEVGDKYPLYNAFAQQEAQKLLAEVQKHL